MPSAGEVDMRISARVVAALRSRFRTQSRFPQGPGNPSTVQIGKGHGVTFDQLAQRVRNGLFEAVSGGQSVGRIDVERGVRPVFRAVASEPGRDQNRLAADEVPGFGPKIRPIIREVITEPVVEASRVGDRARTAAQYFQARLDHREVPVERGLPLDGFHQCAGPGVFRPHTLAVVNGDGIAGLGNPRGVDRQPEAVQARYVAQSCDSERACDDRRARERLLARHGPLGLGRRMLRHTMYMHRECDYSVSSCFLRLDLIVVCTQRVTSAPSGSLLWMKARSSCALTLVVKVFAASTQSVRVARRTFFSAVVKVSKKLFTF